MTGTTSAIIVAIPARNEADYIGACLGALAAQPGAAHHVAGAIVFANGCTDATAAIARAVTAPFPIDVIEAEPPPEAGHAGWARRSATAAAGAMLDRIGHGDGIIATTDADSRVDTGWLAALTVAFGNGADSVAGTIALDPDGPLAPELVRARAMEADHADTMAAAAHALDPLPWDPWPNHIWSWGANLAVRADVLAAVGGVPDVPLAEDRALHDMLLRSDVRVRHAPEVRVWTSARPVGRAPGGFADLLQQYAASPDVLADFALEPAAVSWRRAMWRGRARDLWNEGDHAALAALARRLGAADIAGDHFGKVWAAIEAASPDLARQRVALAALPSETAALRARIARFSLDGDAAGRSDNQARRGGATSPHAATSP